MQGTIVLQLSLTVKMYHLTPDSGTHDKHYLVRAKETTPHVLLVCSSDYFLKRFTSKPYMPHFKEKAFLTTSPTSSSSRAIVVRALDELVVLSSETEVPKFMGFFFLQQIAKDKAFANMLCDQADNARSCITKLHVMICEMDVMDDHLVVFDSLVCLKESKQRLTIDMERHREGGLCWKVLFNELLKMGSDTKLFTKACAGFLRDRYAGLRMSISKNQRLITKLEALGERGDAVRYVDYIREIISRDSAKLGALEQLLAGTHVGLGLKDGYVADMEEKD
ncbi:hypothetical protein Tco_1080456 [Tanacetum coccineum]|uniref:BTB domain-containing protein n=1 Tax=Tanacetum coccineum TaxID=301880 RepID=A0ABQ5HUR0_9ASTR